MSHFNVSSTFGIEMWTRRKFNRKKDVYGHVSDGNRYGLFDVITAYMYTYYLYVIYYILYVWFAFGSSRFHIGAYRYILNIILLVGTQASNTMGWEDMRVQEYNMYIGVSRDCRMSVNFPLPGVFDKSRRRIPKLHILCINYR